MINYNQAFDLYHAVYRQLILLDAFDKEEYLELDRLRIWDFYFLFPDKLHEISFKRTETDKHIKAVIRGFIKKTKNPYLGFTENKKIFEKINPYQTSALHCLASYGIIDKSALSENRIKITCRETLNKELGKFPELDDLEKNVRSLMVGSFYFISLFGNEGLKAKTKLMETKYDSE